MSETHRSNQDEPSALKLQELSLVATTQTIQENSTTLIEHKTSSDALPPSSSRATVASCQLQTRKQLRKYNRFDQVFLTEKQVQQESLLVQLDESDLLETSTAEKSAFQNYSRASDDFEEKLYPIRLPSDSNRENDRRYRQSQLLLVSLLENFCKVYEQSPERSRRLFYTLCKTLSQMGMIESADFLEEMWTVRESYKRAFRELVVQALASFQQEDARRLQSDIIKSNEASEWTGDVKVQLLTASSSATSTPPPGELDFSSLFNNRSRFGEDFAYVKILGKGAFGRVSHVRNRLDGRDYAVKQIRLTLMDQDMELILREVRFHSRITHPNVVQYFGSWLEHGEMSPYKNEMLDSDDSDYEDGSSHRVSSPAHEDQSSSILFQMDSQSNQNSFSRSDGQKIIRMSSSDAIPRLGFQDWSLFIQMELCQTTLDDWLKERNQRLSTTSTPNTLSFDDFKEAMSIFRDILKGLVHIHKQNCIHRDLKPKNIFWKASDQTHISQDAYGIHVEHETHGRWKIGDFGLATLSDPSFITDDLPSANRTIGVGTVTYASPEQLQSEPNSLYTCSSDIYSLGIILFELMYPFGSGMERALTLTNLRQRILPDGFVKAFPKESALILWMTMADPHSRPSSLELLELELFPLQSHALVSEDGPSLGTSPIRAIFTEESRPHAPHSEQIGIRHDSPSHTMIPDVEHSSFSSSDSSLHSRVLKNQLRLLQGELDQTKQTLVSVQEENKELKRMVAKLSEQLRAASEMST